jgi:hypothetical protein
VSMGRRHLRNPLPHRARAEHGERLSRPQIESWRGGERLGRSEGGSRYGRTLRGFGSHG